MKDQKQGGLLITEKMLGAKALMNRRPPQGVKRLVLRAFRSHPLPYFIMLDYFISYYTILHWGVSGSEPRALFRPELARMSQLERLQARFELAFCAQFSNLPKEPP